MDIAVSIVRKLLAIVLMLSTVLAMAAAIILFPLIVPVWLVAGFVNWCRERFK